MKLEWTPGVKINGESRYSEARVGNMHFIAARVSVRGRERIELRVSVYDLDGGEAAKMAAQIAEDARGYTEG